MIVKSSGLPATPPNVCETAELEAGVHLENARKQQKVLKHFLPMRRTASHGLEFVGVFLFVPVKKKKKVHSPKGID